MSLRPVLLRALRQTRPQPTIPALTRALHLTPALSKKAPKRNTTDHQSPKTSSPPSANKSTKDVGVLDLKAEIDGVATALKDIARGLQTQLQKLRSHARHEPAVIEGVMVNMQGEGQVRLGDLAHVVGNVGSGKSRGIGVVVYEQANVKRIISALNSPPHNLNPQPNTQDPLKLEIPLPPPTKEDRIKTAELVGKEGDKALGSIKDLRHEVRKKIKNGGGRPDDVVKAEKKLEGVVKEGTEEVKKMVDAAKKSILEG